MTRKEEIDKEANSFANTVSVGEQETAKNWSAFISGAEWADKTMIDKACEWLDRYFENKVFKTQRESIINDFKKYMEE